ncbi:MAG: Bro-N domain-containing protein [Oscillospiraceae bacterium]|nr:Bro-N domain-containing protein [Oscillospiraceae bacterium]
MNDLTIFNNPEFGSVRTLEIENGKILFCGADVATALGYANAPDAIKKHCKVDGIAKCDTVDNSIIKTT